MRLEPPSDPSHNDRREFGEKHLANERRPQRPGILAYLKEREITHLPSGPLRWWLLGLIVLGWAVEQYEALKIGPVLVYILEDFDKTLVQWGYVAALVGLLYRWC